tara:strand:+ start:43 stop:750 length:708 start_codon:yes stop_codon:yes gene_type:complete
MSTQIPPGVSKEEWDALIKRHQQEKEARRKAEADRKKQEEAKKIEEEARKIEREKRRNESAVRLQALMRGRLQRNRNEAAQNVLDTWLDGNLNEAYQAKQKARRKAEEYERNQLSRVSLKDSKLTPYYKRGGEEFDKRREEAAKKRQITKKSHKRLTFGGDSTVEELLAELGGALVRKNQAEEEMHEAQQEINEIEAQIAHKKRKAMEDEQAGAYQYDPRKKLDEHILDISSLKF